MKHGRDFQAVPGHRRPKAQNARPCAARTPCLPAGNRSRNADLFRHPCNHSPAFQQHRHACDAERAAQRGHDTQGSDCTGKKPSPPGHGRPTDRRPLGRILPSGRIPSGNARALHAAAAPRSLIGSINEQHAGCHFPGQGRRQACQTDRGAVPSGFQRAPLPRTGRCVRALLPAPEPAGGAEAPLPDVHNAAVRLRGIDRGLGIVAIAAFPDAESRIRTLLCGADACLSPRSADWSWPRSCRRWWRAAGMDAEPGDIRPTESRPATHGGWPTRAGP